MHYGDFIITPPMASPVFNYPYGRTREALAQLARTDAWDPCQDLAAEAASKNPRGVKPASFVVDDLLVHHVMKHQNQIRRNISQFNERHPPA